MPPWLAFFGILQLVLGTSALAQDVVTDCDKYAANALDPQRNSTGVDFENLNVALAFPACEDAVRKFSNSMRLVY